MAIRRIDFEQVVFLKPGSEYRRALMIYSLAYTGISWKSWSDQGENVAVYYPPNDVIFACLYANYRAAPTKAKFMQLSFMLMPRNKQEAGFMIDPAHRTSGARKAALSKIPGVSRGEVLASENWLLQVYSEMWLTDGGSLRGWAAQQPQGVEGILRDYEKNKLTVQKSTELMTYFETLRKKFCGEGMAQSSITKANVSAFSESEVGFNVQWGRLRSNGNLPRPIFN